MPPKIFVRIKCVLWEMSLWCLTHVGNSMNSYFLIFFFFYPVLNMPVFNSQVALVLRNWSLYHAGSQYIPYRMFERILSCNQEFLTDNKMAPCGYFQQVLFLELFFCTQQSRGDGMGSSVGTGKNLEWSVHGRVPSHMLEFDLAVFIRTWRLIS